MNLTKEDGHYIERIGVPQPGWLMRAFGVRRTADFYFRAPPPPQDPELFRLWAEEHEQRRQRALDRWFEHLESQRYKIQRIWYRIGNTMLVMYLLLWMVNFLYLMDRVAHDCPWSCYPVFHVVWYGVWLCWLSSSVGAIEPTPPHRRAASTRN